MVPQRGRVHLSRIPAEMKRHLLDSSSSALPAVLEEPSKPSQVGSIAHTAAKVALQAAFRGLQPDNREAFARQPDISRLRRLYYTTQDGWRAPIYHLPVLTRGSGEPVVIAHGLGLNHNTLQFDKETSLAWTLQRAGYAVYLISYRCDSTAISPDNMSGDYDFDDIAHKDVPAAIDAVLQHSSFPKLMWIGHGLGGQLLYGHLANEGSDLISAATTICTPTLFDEIRTAARARTLALSLIPRDLTFPISQLATLAAPALRGHREMKRVKGAKARGVLLYGTESLNSGLLRQVNRWISSGFLCDRSGAGDIVEGMVNQKLPLQVIYTTQSEIKGAARPLGLLQGDSEVIELGDGWGRFDPLLGEDAHRLVHPRVLDWINRHRPETWRNPRVSKVVTG